MAPPAAKARWPEDPSEPFEPPEPYVTMAQIHRGRAPREQVALAPTKPRLTQKEAQALLAEATQELVDLQDTADALTVRRLGVRIQRLRIACKLLAESEDGEYVSDETLTKELGLLNRLIGGKDLGVPDTTTEDERQQARMQLLKDRGVADDAAAARIVRVLEAVMVRADPSAPSSAGQLPADRDRHGSRQP